MTKLVNKQWQGSIAISTALHFILIIVFLFGMPSIFETLPEGKNALTFEILPLSAITNIKNENKSTQQAKIAKKSREVKKSQPKPKPQPTPKIVEPPKKKIEKKAPPQEAKKEVAPLQKTKPLEKPKEQPKPIPQNDEDAVDSTLKNLEKDSKGNDAKISTRSNEEQKSGDKYSRGMDYDEESPLSITEELFLKNQIKKHYHQPSGLPDTSKITLLILLEKDGSLKKVTLGNIICSASRAICNLFEESVFRAVKAASPFLDLPPERYDIWKKFDLEFDPATMAQ